MRTVLATLVFGTFLGFIVSPTLAGAKAEPGGVKEGGVKQEEPKALTVNESLTNADGFDTKRNGCHHKVHTYKMVPGYQYTIDLKSKAFDAYLRLEDSKGKELAFNDDFDGLDSRIVFTPKEADTYKIIATTFGPGATGAYTLTVQPAKAGAVAQPGKALEVQNGKLTINDSLAATDQRHKVRTQSYHKVHVVKMLAGKTYTITMSSNQLDSYLFLDSPAGVQLAFDDDGGGFPTARIVYNINQAGDYRISATTFGANSTGQYTITIDEK